MKSNLKHSIARAANTACLRTVNVVSLQGHGALCASRQLTKTCHTDTVSLDVAKTAYRHSIFLSMRLCLRSTGSTPLGRARVPPARASTSLNPVTFYHPYAAVDNVNICVPLNEMLYCISRARHGWSVRDCSSAIVSGRLRDPFSLYEHSRSM